MLNTNIPCRTCILKLAIRMFFFPQVDVTVLGETLNSAMKVMEMIALHIKRFMSKVWKFYWVFVLSPKFNQKICMFGMNARFKFRVK